MRSSRHTHVTPEMFKATEKRRFDALEPEHLAQLESERIGRNDSRLRHLGRLLVEQGMTEHADALLAVRNDCAAQATDAGGDRRIHQLLDDVKHNLTDLELRSKISEPYRDLEDLMNRHNWSRFRSCWEHWENIVSILDHRLIAIDITGLPDKSIVDFKSELDDFRDRVVAALRPFANWYSWHLDVSLLRDNRHPHYHCLFVVPAKEVGAVFDAVDDLKKHAFWNDDGLHVQYRDWLDYDRRRRMLDVAERQRSWIAALAYVTRVISHRPLPKSKAVPPLSSFLDVDDHMGQIRQEWDMALQKVLKGNDCDKALGARRMALFLRKETRRRVVSFRQSKRWRSFQSAVQSVAPLPAFALAGEGEGGANLWLQTLEAETLVYKLRAPAVEDSESERCSELAAEQLEQKESSPPAEPAPDDDSKSSLVIHQGFKENPAGCPRRKNPVGRPPREITHQDLMLAIIDGGTCTAAAAILRTSTRRVREEMENAGIAPFPPGRPMKRDLLGRPWSS